MLDKKITIFDTQGFNDTADFKNATIASKIMNQLMSKSSTKQFDAVWIVHSAKSDRSYLNAIFSNF